MHDKGGRTGYAEYPGQTNGAGGSSSGSGAGPSTSNATGPNYPSGYVAAQGTQRAAASSTSSLPSQSVATPAPASTPVVTRVKALHTFEPTEPGELAFEKGDIIKVVDRGYKDWWRGQLKGRTGIFPVNYVVSVSLLDCCFSSDRTLQEPLPELTAAELAREAEQEATVFAQAANVDRLLTMLRTVDSSGENLADNEEIQVRESWNSLCDVISSYLDRNYIVLVCLCGRRSSNSSTNTARSEVRTPDLLSWDVLRVPFS